MTIWQIGILCMSTLLSSQLNAAEVKDTDPIPNIAILEPLDAQHDAASQSVTQLANWLDSFFATDLVFDESQKSQVKLNLLQITEKGNKPRYEVRLQGNLTLPHTQERLNILFESDPEENNGADNTVIGAVESTEQSLGLRYVQYSSKWFRAHTDAGIRFHSGLDSFVRFRLRGLFTAGDWQFRATETLFWRDSTGPGETSRLDIERRLSEDYLFRSTSQATWLDETQQFDMGQDFLVIHNISKYRGIIYRAGLTAASEPETHTTAYILSVRLRQQIHRDWLFFEINPMVVYPEEEDFHSRPSLTFKLEVVFGGI